MKSASHKKFDVLSPRERKVIGLAAAGMLDKQIGPELGVSLNTLRTYWGRIRDKVGSESRPALVAAYVREELGKAGSLDSALDSHDGWIIDPKTHLVTATDQINDDHGLARGVPHPFSEYGVYIHPDDLATVRQMFYDVIEGRKDGIHITYRVVTEQGIELGAATLQSVRDDAGKVTRVYGFRTQSVDPRPGANVHVRVGHWEESDYESEFFTVDEEMARILGCPGPGEVSRSAEMTWKRHPDDEARIRAECLDAIAKKKEHLVTDVRLMLGDGSVVWGRAKRRFVYEDDGKVRIFGTFSVFQ